MQLFKRKVNKGHSLSRKGNSLCKKEQSLSKNGKKFKKMPTARDHNRAIRYLLMQKDKPTLLQRSNNISNLNVRQKKSKKVESKTDKSLTLITAKTLATEPQQGRDNQQNKDKNQDKQLKQNKQNNSQMKMKQIYDQFVGKVFIFLSSGNDTITPSNVFSNKLLPQKVFYFLGSVLQKVKVGRKMGIAEFVCECQLLYRQCSCEDIQNVIEQFEYKEGREEDGDHLNCNKHSQMILIQQNEKGRKQTSSFQSQDKGKKYSKQNKKMDDNSIQQQYKFIYSEPPSLEQQSNNKEQSNINADKDNWNHNKTNKSNANNVNKENKWHKSYGINQQFDRSLEESSIHHKLFNTPEHSFNSFHNKEEKYKHFEEYKYKHFQQYKNKHFQEEKDYSKCNFYQLKHEPSYQSKRDQIKYDQTKRKSSIESRTFDSLKVKQLSERLQNHLLHNAHRIQNYRRVMLNIL